MNKDLQDRVIATINGYIPNPVNDFLEDHKSDQNNLVNLVITLKYWANPLGAYSIALNKDKLDSYFDYLQKILLDPKKLLSQEKNFTAADESEIRDLVRIKLNKIADEVIEQYNLKVEIEKRVQNNQAAAKIWWDNKTESEKKALQQQYQNLNQRQIIYLQQVTYIQAPPSSASVNLGYIDPFTLYCMSNSMAHLSCYAIEGVVKLTGLGIRAAGGAIHAIGRIGANGGWGGGDCGKEGFAIAVIIAAILAFVALLASSIVAGVYAGIKTAKSVANLSEGYKVARSVYRLVGTAGGVCIGAIKGVALGAILGSVIPGFGTLAGAIIGGILGAALGAGLGALITKYSAKLISFIFNSQELNPTNPDKYKLTEKQKMNLQNKGYDLSVINEMIKAIHQEKNNLSKKNLNKGIQKERLNECLKQIKNGEIPGAVKIGAVTYDPFLSRFNAMKPVNIEKNSTAVVMRSAVYNGEIKPSAPPMNQSENEFQPIVYMLDEQVKPSTAPQPLRKVM